MYNIISYRPGSPEPVYAATAHTLREARSLAYRAARRVGSAPVWVDGAKAWNDTAVVGGYDARTSRGYTGEACAVVARGAP